MLKRIYWESFVKIRQFWADLLCGNGCADRNMDRRTDGRAEKSILMSPAFFFTKSGGQNTDVN